MAAPMKPSPYTAPPDALLLISFFMTILVLVLDMKVGINSQCGNPDKSGQVVEINQYTNLLNHQFPN